MQKEGYFLLGEIISPQKITDKSSFHHLLQETCENINFRYNEDLLYPLQITQGIHNISGVFTSINSIYSIINSFFESTHPHIMRFVLCRGELNNFSQGNDINLMEGSAINRSHEMMENLNKTNLLFDLEIEDSFKDSGIKWPLNMILILKSKWSPQKLNIVLEYNQKANQCEVAQKIGISQQAVSKNISTSMIKEIQLAEKDLNANLLGYNDIKIEGNDLNEYSTLNKWLKD